MSCTRTAFLLVVAASAGLGCATVSGARHYQAGTAALERGDAERAVQDLETAARELPEASEIQNHLGLAYEASGRPAAALAAFERAVALDCDNQPARHNLALARHRLRRQPGLPDPTP